MIEEQVRRVTHRIYADHQCATPPRMLKQINPYQGDQSASTFLAILPVHPENKSRGQAGGEADKKGLNDTE